MTGKHRDEMKRELLEHEAKALLCRHGIAVPAGRLATGPEEAAIIARELVSPVAMKVVAAGLVHKSTAGCVRLNVDAANASAAFKELLTAAEQSGASSVKGVLIERMVPPGIEVVIGVSSIPEFGPSVMFGSGGLDVEYRGDVACRLAPLSPDDARNMVEETSVAARFRAHKRFRDAALDAIVDALLIVGGSSGLFYLENIHDLDINPLIVTADGIIAVDAYATLSTCNPLDLAEIGVIDSASRQAAQSAIYAALRPLFMPESIVVVGASSRPGKLGFEIIKCLVDYGFPGPVCGVNPSVNNIYGCPVYSSIADLPDKIDRAIVAVPAAAVPEALRQCARKGVRVAHVYSAGFSEWTEGSDELEHTITYVVTTTGMRVVGPNSNGAFCASGRLTKTPARYTPDAPGTITFISQSGTYTSDLIARGKVMGLPIGKSLACGNCLDVGPIDYLLYCAEDQETKIIAMYLETVNDIGRFFRLAREIEKPLVIIKGGKTGAGNRVAATHTGALASDERLWLGAAKQAGAIVVDNIPDLIDVLLGFSAFGSICGRGLALFTSGGGISVTATDVAVACGLDVPVLGSKATARLSKFIMPGTSITNPVDIPVWGLRTESGYILNEMITSLIGDPDVHSLIVTAEMGSIFNYARDEADGLAQMQSIVESVTQVPSQEAAISLVLRSTGDKAQDDCVRDARPRLLAKGIAVYSSVTRAIRAHAKLVELGARRR